MAWYKATLNLRLRQAEILGCIRELSGSAKTEGEGAEGGEWKARISGAMFLNEVGLVLSESEAFNDLGATHLQKPGRQMGRGLGSPGERSQLEKQILEKNFCTVPARPPKHTLGN